MPASLGEAERFGVPVPRLPIEMLAPGAEGIEPAEAVHWLADFDRDGTAAEYVAARVL